MLCEHVLLPLLVGMGDQVGVDVGFIISFCAAVSVIDVRSSRCFLLFVLTDAWAGVVVRGGFVGGLGRGWPDDVVIIAGGVADDSIWFAGGVVRGGAWAGAGSWVGVGGVGD